MVELQNIDNEERNKILNDLVKSSNMNVTMRNCRFPPMDGIQSDVTLQSNVSGMFMQIYFSAGVDNTIKGHIADRLIDLFPTVFKVIAVNGVLVHDGKKSKADKELSSEIKKQILEELKEEYDFVPKVEDKPVNRVRADEPKTAQTTKK
jgi:hypothetical protein